MQRSFDVLRALREFGRDGDFNRVSELRMKYKSHRTTSDLAPRAVNIRTRGNWGEIKRPPPGASAALDYEISPSL